MTVATGPLAGVRVLDLTMNLSGPFGTMVLAEQGADVIKVERPPGGDILRRISSSRGGTSGYFVNTNWGKRSIALDFNDAADLEVLGQLVATADVLVENFRPAVMAGIGFGADALLARHPRLVYAAIRGFPTGSPLADAPAYDHVIQAMTGYAATQADLKTGQPVLVQQAVVDKATGLVAAQAITAALFERHRTGRGQVLEIPMFHVALSFVWPDSTTTTSMVGDYDRLPPPSRSFRLTATADGHLAMVVVTDPQWDGLLRATGRDDLLGHPDYLGPQQRGRNAGPVMREIAALIATMPTDEIVTRLAGEGVPVAAVASLDDLEAVAARVAPGYLRHDLQSTVGEIVHPSPPVTFDEAVEVRPAPDVGEHSDEIRAELRGKTAG